MNNPLQTNNLTIPIAIVIAGALIAGAVLLSNDSVKPGTGALGSVTTVQPTDTTNTINPITDKDHLQGDINAPIKIVEYSDFECPFCKRFHGTMQQIISKYGAAGQVAWIYRHFPLDSLHSKARAEAVASECVNELGGNNAFWKFADRFFELSPSNDQTDIGKVIPQIVTELGLDQKKFTECAQSGKYDEHIQNDIDNAVATGGTGTPWSIVIAPNGKTFPLSGAQTYETVTQLIEFALQQK